MILKSKKEFCELDAMLPEVIEFAVAAKRVSISSIQRKFTIGYPRAARMMYILVGEGIVEETFNATRRVLVSQEEYDAWVKRQA